MSSSLDRQIAGYLDPKQYALFIGYCERENMGKSAGLKIIIKEFFSSMPLDKQQEYLQSASELEGKNVAVDKISWPG